MAEVAFTLTAEDFGSFGEESDIVFEGDILGINGLSEAGPSSARFKLRLGAKKGPPAPCTDVGSFRLTVPVLAGKSFFGSLLSQNLVLLRGELFFPRKLLPFSCSKGLKTSRDFFCLQDKFNLLTYTTRQ